MNEEELIKQTLATPGWTLIEKILKDETLEARTAKYIDPEKDVNELGYKTKALGYACKIMDRALKKVYTRTNKTKVKEEIFR